MLNVVKVGSFLVEADTKKECEERIGKRVSKVSKTQLMDKSKKFLFEVSWQDQACTFQATVIIYYCFDMAEIDERHCVICKESHNLFYNNHYFNCHRCEYAAYLQRAKDRERSMRSAGKEVLRRGK